MIIKCLSLGAYQANCYIVIDEETRECAIFDPGDEPDVIIRLLSENNVKVKYILLTHGHLDHTGAADEVRYYTNAPIAINRKDEEFMLKGTPLFNLINKGNLQHKNADIYLQEGDSFKIGKEEIKCIETPGHSPGGVCFVVGNNIFTGDTLFQNSIGRTDFAGGDYATLISSIKNKLLSLEDDMIIYPGHGNNSTIGYERLNNYYLKESIW